VKTTKEQEVGDMLPGFQNFGVEGPVRASRWD